MKHIFKLSILLVTVLFTSCAAEPVTVEECLSGKEVGFWYGLWHGMISPIAFVIGLFDPEITFYAVNNNGNWYNFGFLMGVGAFSSGASKTTDK